MSWTIDVNLPELTAEFTPTELKPDYGDKQIVKEYVDVETYPGSYTVTPAQQTQTLGTNGYLMADDVKVNPIPPEYIVPTGTKTITSNGTGIDVKSYADVDVAVPGSAPVLQTKSLSITPTESAQSSAVTADVGYDGLEEVDVTVSAISSTYVGSGITRRDSSDLSKSGATINVPAGYYESSASKSVTSGTAGTPTASKGTVSSNAISVTPKVTNTSGYITGSTITGTSVSVSASELVSGTYHTSSNGTFDITNYASVHVTGIPSSSDAVLIVIVPTGSTVTATKGATTKTPTIWTRNANNTLDYALFTISSSLFDSVNPWTVTATLGGDSATKTIVINAADEYDLAFYAFLPSGYTPVEYIESTGTQYINLTIGKTVNINAIKILADLTVEGGATSSAFMGNIDATPYFAFVRLYSQTQIEPTLNSDGSTTGVYDTTLFHRRVSYGYEGSNGTITISKNGETWYTGSRGTRNLSAVPLFSLYSYRMNAKLFGFKFYDTDHTTLLRDLYPCYRNSDSVVGLYDKVSETFLTNAGSGSFIVGGNI